MNNYYLIIYRPPRPGFAEDVTPQESEIIGRHFEYLKRLLADGRLILAGRRDDAEFGIAVVRAKSEAEARYMMEEDPSVAAGIFTGEVHQFRLALLTEDKPE